MAKRGAHATNNSFEWLCREYLTSSKFSSLALTSQKLWGRELCDAMEVLGAALLKAKNEKEEERTIRPKMVVDYLGALSDRPAKARAALAALKALSAWAEVSDLINRDFTRKVTVPRPDSGHIPWTDEQVAIGITHARPDIARVILLASCTGQRRSDLVKMRWSDITTEAGRQGIEVTQKKTGVRLWIPVNKTLAAALEMWERKPGHILLDQNNKPWTEENLSTAWYRELRKNPALAPLRGLVIHGLRGHVCVGLYRAGCTTKDVSEMVGMSEQQVKGYTKLASNKENNLATIIRLENFRGTNVKKAEGER